MKWFFLSLLFFSKFILSMESNDKNNLKVPSIKKARSSCLPKKNDNNENNISIKNNIPDMIMSSRVISNQSNLDLKEYAQLVVSVIDFLHTLENRPLLIKIFDKTDKIIRTKSKNWENIIEEFKYFSLLEYKGKLLGGIYKCLKSDDIEFCLEKLVIRISFCFSNLILDKKDFIMYADTFSYFMGQKLYEVLNYKKPQELKKPFYMVFSLLAQKIDRNRKTWIIKKKLLNPIIEFNKNSFLIKPKKCFIEQECNLINFDEIERIEKNEDKKKIKIFLYLHKTNGEQIFYRVFFKSLLQMDAFFEIFQVSRTFCE